MALRTTASREISTALDQAISNACRVATDNTAAAEAEHIAKNRCISDFAEHLKQTIQNRAEDSRRLLTYMHGKGFPDGFAPEFTSVELFRLDYGNKQIGEHRWVIEGTRSLTLFASDPREADGKAAGGVYYDDLPFERDGYSTTHRYQPIDSADEVLARRLLSNQLRAGLSASQMIAAAERIVAVIDKHFDSALAQAHTHLQKLYPPRG